MAASASAPITRAPVRDTLPKETIWRAASRKMPLAKTVRKAKLKINGIDSS
ncbi:MAG: hypothetical protein HUU41_08015 [Bryobacteraceae bacterium]|nr:hypothetical protein [Bryobacteraceae bacterium]